jgi:RHS repeat-associated protein
MGMGWRHSYSRRLVPRYSEFSIRPYEAVPSSSSAYATAGSACADGFAQIKSQITNWQSGTANLVNSRCEVSAGGVVIGTIPVYSTRMTQPNAQPIAVDAIRDDGQRVSFRVGGGSTYVAQQGSELRLEGVSGGYKLTDASDNIELYDSTGRLNSVSTSGGVALNLTYASTTLGGRLTRITDSFGSFLSFTYDAFNLLRSVSLPSGAAVQYAYDASGRLTSVTRADGAVVGLQYQDTSFPGAMTGHVDEDGQLYSIWSYDSAGRATQTSEAGGAGLTTLTYNADGSVLVVDALGAARTFTYNRQGVVDRAVAITGSQCPTCRDGAATAYDVSGFVASRLDYNGNLTCYANDPVRGLELVRVEGFAPGASCPTDLSAYVPPSGTNQRKVVTSWHSAFRRPLQITEASRSIAFTYDANGNTLTRTVTDTSVAPSVSRTWSYAYNGFGRVLTEDGPRTDVSDVTTYTYYNCTTGFQCGQVNTVTNAKSQVTTFNTYNAHGQPTQITDPNGVVTTLAYDLRQRVTARCANGALPSCAGGELTAMEYWPTGLLKKVTLPDGSFTSYGYDAAHRLTSVADSAGNHVDYTLDAMGNRTAENVFDPASSLKRTHSRVFNTLNQLYQDVNAAATGSATTTFAYDNNGNQTAVNAPLGRNSANLYDELNRLKQITDPALGNTYFAYDANDNLTSVTDPKGLITSYAYNGFGDLLTQTSPDTAITVNTYDTGGNLKTSTDARSAVATYAYDQLNRVTSVAYAKAGITDQTISFTYDAGVHGKGRLTGAADANHAMGWVYDAQGRIINKSQTVGAVTRTAGYGYTNGNLTTLTLPSGNVVSYGYNPQGQVSSIALGATTVLNNVTYEPFGPVSGWSWGNGMLHTRGHDADGRVSSISTSHSNGVNLGFTYDVASRITNVADVGASPGNWSYGYDALDRLISAQSPALTQGWTYDANGNRLSESGSQASAFSVSSTSNRLNSTAGFLNRTYSYDAAGNALAYEDVTLSYNNRNRLASTTKGASTRFYTYNALGQMVKATGGAGGTVHYLHDEAGHLLGEYDSTGNLIQETVWLGDLPIATIRPDAVGTGVDVFYVHADQLGTPRLVTDVANNLRWRWPNDPFGTLAAEENPASLGAFVYNLRFPGQMFDGQAGLHQNMFRDYSPAIGRYVESDPVGLNAGVNTYGYALQNPIWYSDMFGLDVQICNRPADLPFPMNLFDHWWVKTGKYEVGMGPLNGQVPAQEGRSDRPGDPVQTVDHSGQSKAKNSSCEVMKNVDEDCVNKLIMPGQALGRWHPFNQCNSFAWYVVTKCRKGPQIPPNSPAPKMSGKGGVR